MDAATVTCWKQGPAATVVIILWPWVLRQWMCWSHGRFLGPWMLPQWMCWLHGRRCHPLAMDVVHHVIILCHGCCDRGCAGCTPLGMDAAKVDMLVARTLPSFGDGCCAKVDMLVAWMLPSLGHGCCDSGFAARLPSFCDSGRYHLEAMDAATVDVLGARTLSYAVARTLSSLGHECCNIGYVLPLANYN